MKVKNIVITILLVISAIVVFNSCSDFIELSPTSSYSIEGFESTESSFDLAMHGAYSPLRSLYNYEIAYTMTALSDERRIEQINYPYHLLNRFLIDPNNVIVDRLWNQLYTIVTRSNFIIENIDDVDYSDENRKSNIKGEAYFLRGFAYFHLGWMYGGVPLIDRNMTVEEVSEIPRSTQLETFDFAGEDLITAATLLPEMWPSDELGKATKFSAQGILARLYLLQNEFSDAKPLLESIINSGIYQLADQYSHIFLDQYDNSPEHVFQVQYTSGSVGQGNSIQHLGAPELISLEEPFFPLGGASRYSFVSEDLYNAYEEGDVRRDINFQEGYTLRDGTSYSDIVFIKFNHGSHPSSRGDYELNMPVLRYTDVKLMYAEVLNEENYNPDGEAFSILNEIRERAGVESYTSSDIPTQDAFREALLEERRLEFAYEFLRWFDLIRTGKAMSVMNNREGYVNQMEEHHHLLPIPEHELSVTTDDQIMWQNPGY